jgi:DNA sulfur modification protein DndB
MKEKTNTRIRLVPAVRGIFGTWVYYSALLSLKDVADHIKVAEEIHPNKKLSEMIQRELKKKRATEIAEYLCTQKERFLNSLVVAVYGGEPKWFAVSDITPQTPEFDPSTLDEDTLASIGFLSLSGDETFFALDGQHRLAGIRKALQKDRELGLDEINVLFVAHQETEQGRQRTRRLFTTLNKRARPVSKGSIIALDEDDTMAIISRCLVEQNPWFTGNRIVYQATNNMPPKNRSAFTSIGALYDLLSLLFCGVYGASRQKLKYYRPSDEDLKGWYEKADQFFHTLYNHFPDFHEFCDAENEYAVVTSKHRNKDGGSVLFRPIGLIILGEVLARLKSFHKKAKINDLVAHVCQIEWNLSVAPFNNIIWDAAAQRMITGTKVLCRDLVLFTVGEVSVQNSVIQKYAKAKGVSTNEAEDYVESLPQLEALNGQ